jgi:hypothetical protein
VIPCLNRGKVWPSRGVRSTHVGRSRCVSHVASQQLKQTPEPEKLSRITPCAHHAMRTTPRHAHITPRPCDATRMSPRSLTAGRTAARAYPQGVARLSSSTGLFGRGKRAQAGEGRYRPHPNILFRWGSCHRSRRALRRTTQCASNGDSFLGKGPRALVRPRSLQGGRPASVGRDDYLVVACVRWWPVCARSISFANSLPTGGSMAYPFRSVSRFAHDETRPLPSVHFMHPSVRHVTSAVPCRSRHVTLQVPCPSSPCFK